jgi:hypothetical protein
MVSDQHLVLKNVKAVQNVKRLSQSFFYKLNVLGKFRWIFTIISLGPRELFIVHVKQNHKLERNYGKLNFILTFTCTLTIHPWMGIKSRHKNQPNQPTKAIYYHINTKYLVPR